MSIDDASPADWDRLRDKHPALVKKYEDFVKDNQDPVPEGKSGNMKLATKCSYCQYKKHCYPNLRAFSYYGGPKFFSHIEVEPKVQELNID